MTVIVVTKPIATYATVQRAMPKMIVLSISTNVSTINAKIMRLASMILLLITAFVTVAGRDGCKYA